MNFDEAVEHALRSPRAFDSLRDLVLELYSHGTDKDHVLGLFEAARQRLRDADREADEDVLMEVMDCIVGWCGPHMRLEPGKGIDPNHLSPQG